MMMMMMTRILGESEDSRSEGNSVSEKTLEVASKELLDDRHQQHCICNIHRV